MARSCRRACHRYHFPPIISTVIYTNLAKDKVKELESQLKEASEAVDKWMHYMAAYHEASAEAELLRADLKEQREKNIKLMKKITVYNNKGTPWED